MRSNGEEEEEERRNGKVEGEIEKKHNLTLPDDKVIYLSHGGEDEKIIFLSFVLLPFN